MLSSDPQTQRETFPQSLDGNLSCEIKFEGLKYPWKYLSTSISQEGGPFLALTAVCSLRCWFHHSTAIRYSKLIKKGGGMFQLRWLGMRKV